MMDHLSATQINLYLECSLKYKFQYLDELPKPFKSSGQAFGSATHSSLEWFHKEKIRGNHISLEKLYKIMEVDWYSQRVETEIHYKEGETEEGLLLKGKELLGLYYCDPIQEVVAAEFPFQVPLVDPVANEVLEIPLRGIIDLIEKNDSLVEFKTGAKVMDAQSLETNLQLTIYSYVYWMLRRKAPRVLKVINLLKTKNPRMELLETTRDQKDYHRLFSIAKEVLKGIRSEVFFPRQSFMCRDCEYDDHCKKWEGNGRH